MSKIELGKGIALTAPEKLFALRGLTFTKERSQGFASDWALTVEDRPSITIRDITWEVGERDIHTIMPEQLPELPREMPSSTSGAAPASTTATTNSTHG